ncbi:hypothetical protein BJ878DRAFT_582658 [Calycina marina]|uniref:EamA domain-containing protein n=1 Tax=Calycina marina TaxID=1763456 RepID=A0A9P7Z2D0_9HELO|nr:hypothetical protein BJ878DRAFT_582658 [Calycina marina]
MSLRHRRHLQNLRQKAQMDGGRVDDPHHPLLGIDKDGANSTTPHVHGDGIEGEEDDRQMERLSLGKTSQWIVLAVASGGCAAFNGVFAKLTTTELTTTLATWVADSLGLATIEGSVEVVVRALFFGLNIVFNIIMWTLYTKALSRGSSTTQVAIMNTSSNFMVTAILGFIIFSESLPPLWWAGAALLVAGSVITGRAYGDEGRAFELEGGDAAELERKRGEEEDTVSLGSEDNLIRDPR